MKIIAAVILASTCMMFVLGFRMVEVSDRANQLKQKEIQEMIEVKEKLGNIKVIYREGVSK